MQNEQCTEKATIKSHVCAGLGAPFGRSARFVSFVGIRADTEAWKTNAPQHVYSQPPDEIAPHVPDLKKNKEEIARPIHHCGREFVRYFLWL